MGNPEKRTELLTFFLVSLRVSHLGLQPLAAPDAVQMTSAECWIAALYLAKGYFLFLLSICHFPNLSECLFRLFSDRLFDRLFDHPPEYTLHDINHHHNVHCRQTLIILLFTDIRFLPP
jgi:hypothetical protein